MTYTFIARACMDLPVSACCRVLGVSTSGFYDWQANPVREKDLDDAYLSNTIVDIWTMSRRSYGSPRVHAELKLGLDVRCSRKRVERLMRQAQIAGIHRRRRGGCTRRDLDAEPSDDLVKRSFDPSEPDRLWVMDVTEHPTENGKAYLAVVLDAFSRRVVGWSIATCDPSSSSTPSRWLSGGAGHLPVRRLLIRITGRPTRRGPSAGDYAGTACSVP
jgi:putative transposase